jgi:hypothetical protein
VFLLLSVSLFLFLFGSALDYNALAFLNLFCIYESLMIFREEFM